jgi:hypothetical protein
VPPLQSTEDLYRNIRRRSLGVMLLARSEWSKINASGDWLTQWQTRLLRLAPVIYAAQVGAATDGGAAVSLALAEAGYSEPRLGVVVPRAFAGWVSPSWTNEDGLLLTEYLTEAISTARNASGSPQQMLARGGKVLEGLAQFAVTDAAAHAHDVQVVATKGAFSVFTEPGSMCQRCAVLVGKHYRPGTHVKRHPRCDGVMEARADRSGFQIEPTDPSRITDLTIGQRQAIDDGADVNQVVNAKRANTVAGQFTTSGSAQRKTIRRLTPEAIYKIAGNNRAEAVRLLGTHGYIR